MSKKFIPNGDLDFVTMSSHFARTIAKDPQRFEIAQSDCDELTESVARFSAAFQVCRSSGRSPSATRAKEDARADAERIIRHLGHLIRKNGRIEPASKVEAGISQRSEKAKIRPCPQEPPRLRFVRAHHEANGAAPRHELEFSALDHSASKPPGAVRLELYVDLVAPEEPMPAYPGANHAGRPWYLRSYTRSPFTLVPPIPRVPMRVVYWGRWADSTGGVGPFSATAVAWIEGGSDQWLPGGVRMAAPGSKAIPILEDAQSAGPRDRDAKYSVAVCRGASINCSIRTRSRPSRMEALPAPTKRETRQLEGPDAQSEAA